MLCGLGKLENYAGAVPKASEVYVLRLTVVGMPMQLQSEPLDIIAAVGRAFQSGVLWGMGTMDYDIRGACVLIAGSYAVVDVMVTYGEASIAAMNVFKPAETLFMAVNADSQFKAAHPTALVTSGGWYYLSGAEAQNEISYWLSASVLHDHISGKTTAAFDRGENIWYGTAEARQRQWATATPPPIGPGPGTQQPQASWFSKNWYWLGLGALAVGYVYSKRSKR